MIIDLTDVISNADERDRWNSVPLEKIMLIGRDGDKFQLTPEEIQEWKFIGLSNFELLLHKSLESE